jgi:dipeptidyl aminopeptidase/acylaminoacyl peptidase
MRPSEGGRQVIVQRTPEGTNVDLTPSGFNARTRVHEYGGGDYVPYEDSVYFSNFYDQQLYRQIGAASPAPVTHTPEMRYADAIVDSRRSQLICVREDHSAKNSEAINTLVAIPLDGSVQARLLASGKDFYSSPRLSPDGRQLAWLAWDHPNMPWDASELWLGELMPDGSLGKTESVIAGAIESVFQPEWSPDGMLYFVSDRSGWWNLYRVTADGRVQCICKMEAEFGVPQWVFGMQMYAFESPGRIVCAYVKYGASHLGIIDTASGRLEPLETPYTDVSFVCASSGRAVFRAGSPSEPFSIVELDLQTRNQKVLRRANNIQLDPGYISSPEAIEFPSAQGLTAYGFFYPPKNRDYLALKGERPPLLVKSHGGPTSATSTALNLNIQYWTSRGISVLDVNYGGSSGYGRAYRERLNGQWGIVDVDDCVNGARYLVQRGDVDGDRLMIDGGSAGGYTTLCALAFRDAFKAGASYYGVSDAEALARETHKFESRYLDGLIGPYPARRDLYFERSPINFSGKLSCPVIFFQGLEDKVVPPDQAEKMVEVLKRKGIPVAYVAFEGEQHGFRRAQNIKRALDGELYFYSRVFGFELADPVEPVEIENLQR